MRIAALKGIALNEHYEGEGAVTFKHACTLGCEGIVSKKFARAIGPLAQDQQPMPRPCALKRKIGVMIDRRSRSQGSFNQRAMPPALAVHYALLPFLGAARLP
jgi:hypothetical protein